MDWERWAGDGDESPGCCGRSPRFLKSCRPLWILYLSLLVESKAGKVSTVVKGGLAGRAGVVAG